MQAAAVVMLMPTHAHARLLMHAHAYSQASNSLMTWPPMDTIVLALQRLFQHAGFFSEAFERCKRLTSVATMRVPPEN